jgi:hypothetical protein
MKDNMINQYQSIINFLSFLYFALILEFSIHNIQFYELQFNSRNLIISLLAALVASGGLYLSFRQSILKKGVGLIESIFKGWVRAYIVLLSTTFGAVIIISYLSGFSFVPLYNLIKDFSLYTLLITLWIQGNIFYIYWLYKTDKKPKASIAFAIPISSLLMTLVVLLFSLNFDISHLSTFSGLKQDTLAFHVYMRLILIIAVVVLSFFWSVKKIIVAYNSD